MLGWLRRRRAWKQKVEEEADRLERSHGVDAYEYARTARRAARGDPRAMTFWTAVALRLRARERQRQTP